MPTIGVDCELILDGTGYFIKPESYLVKQPRIRQASYRADGSLAYVDLGVGKRTWTITIIARNELLRYDGTLTGLTGQQYRDALHTSYITSIGTTLNYIDPLNGSASAVHFDSYQERVTDLRSQIIGPATNSAAGISYEITIELLEA